MGHGLTFDVSREKQSLDILLSSTMECIDMVDDMVKKFMEGHGLMQHAFAVRVVMREGLTNSVRHGHDLDSEKLIHFNLTINDEKLIMVIEDQGHGFDWRKVRASSSRQQGEGSLRDHGRGFLIMDDYFDSWAYNEKGNILTLEKNISS